MSNTEAVKEITFNLVGHQPGQSKESLELRVQGWVLESPAVFGLIIEFLQRGSTDSEQAFSISGGSEDAIELI